MTRALVSGGTSTIGRAICLELARQGFHIIVLGYQHPEIAAEAVNHIHQTGGSAESILCDIRDTGETRKILETLLENGPIQVIVNNAGYSDDGPMAGMDETQWRHVIDVNLNGFFNVTQPLLLPMIRTRWGRVITISSLSGMIGRKGQTNYAAAKAGLHGASKSLAIEVASRGITVNVVAPGLIESPAISHAFTQEQIENLVPMKRAGTPEEVAHIVAFLASDKAAYISGQIIGVNGAMAS
ncbi:3-oxoacyl-ACP reductase FabG [Candidatus Nitrospira salsa]